MGVSQDDPPDHSPPTVPMLLAAPAAAARVGVSIATLRVATALGEVACVRLRARGTGARGLVRWLEEDLEAWVFAHRVPARPELVAGTPAERASRSRARVTPRGLGTRGRGMPLLSARSALRAMDQD